MIEQTISHYQILEKLGEGGMGVVYKAQDLKLDRLVALKFLPTSFRPTPEEMGRFQQEAKALSSLNHPHIATIFDLDHHDGETFIVLEFLPGGTLKEKIGELSTANQHLPLEQVIEYGIQMAQGLAHAHRHGIIHRDIKTDNMMLTEDGEVKITDFGLAKLRGVRQLTKTGSVVGTAAYMSPEQTRGDELDHRTDIFSLGIILFELVTGRLPFRGEHEAAISYSIVQEDPIPLKSLRSDIPESLENIILRCLEKDKNKRFQSADEIVSEFRKVEQKRSRIAAISVKQPEKKTSWIVGISAALSALVALIAGAGSQVRLYVFILIAVAVVIVAVILTTRRKIPPEFRPLQITLKQLTYAEAVEEYPAWSPDGKQFVFCREVQGYKKIFLKNLGDGRETQLTKGNVDDIQPAWSPDGKSLLFVRSYLPNAKLEPADIFSQFEGGDIWNLDIESGKETKVIDKAFNPSYSPNGSEITLDASWAGQRRIWVVDNRGRNPRQISSDLSEAVVHINPKWSPDGTKIVFQNVERVKFDIRVVDAKSGSMEWVTNDLMPDVYPVWSPSGREIYLSSFRSGGVNIWRIPVADGGAPFGRAQQLTTGAGQDIQASISPDGKRLAYSVVRLNADIWRLPVSPQTCTPTGDPQPFIVSTREESRGAWSPDGTMIAFNSDRSGEMNIWVHSVADGSLRQLTEGPGGDYQPNWSPDGTWIAFFSARVGNPDIWAVEVASRKLRHLTKNPSLEINPFYSPDGQHIVYQSDAAGRLEPWAMRSDGTEQRKLADMEVMGHFMRWSNDGNLVIFRSPNPSKPGLWSVQINDGELTFFSVPKGGSHISFSPNYELIMDVVDHKELWVTPARGGDPKSVFRFDDPQVRIDYPVWSPDGKWILFDRVKPQGGNIWLMEGF